MMKPCLAALVLTLVAFDASASYASTGEFAAFNTYNGQPSNAWSYSFDYNTEGPFVIYGSVTQTFKDGHSTWSDLYSEGPSLYVMSYNTGEGGNPIKDLVTLTVDLSEDFDINIAAHQSLTFRAPLARVGEANASMTFGCPSCSTTFYNGFVITTGDKAVSVAVHEDAYAIYDVSAIPEPSTGALMALGVVGLLGWTRRRRSDSTAV